MDSARTAERLHALLELTSPPLAMAFSDDPPANVPRIERAEAAGCGYWRLAGEGRVFYTLAEDHLGCPVGAYTHGVAMTGADDKALHDTIGVMVGLGYLAESEVPTIPRRVRPLRVVTYAPLAKAPVDPDVVLVRGAPRAVMLLSEAAQAADARDLTFAGLRPACATVPQVLASAQATQSLGCIGSRVYTGLPDGEMWWAAPGPSLEEILDRLERIVHANQALEAHYRGRAASALAESAGDPPPGRVAPAS
ncbi:MAG: DUF169 domain-containing protein [Polyangiaceae bacterium]